MSYTGDVKNMFGTVVGFQKTECHKKYVKPRDFGVMLVEVFKRVKPVISIMDAVVGMEGNGPGSGDLRDDTRIISASSDAVALDRVMETIAGFAPTITTKIADKEGVGIGRLDMIDILPELSSFRLERPFKKAMTPPEFINFVPDSFFTAIGKLLWIRPALDKTLCISCGRCAAMCPVKAIEMVDKYPVWDYDKCVICMCCHEICPIKAAVLQRSKIASLFR
jgi:ferredoxin